MRRGKTRTLGIIVASNPYQPPAASLDEPVVALPMRLASYLPAAFASVAWVLPVLGWMWGATQAPESALSGTTPGIPMAISLAIAFSFTGLFCAGASLYLAYPRQSRTYAVFAPIISRSLAGGFIVAAVASIAGLMLSWGR